MFGSYKVARRLRFEGVGLMVYRVDLAGGGVVGSGCLRRRFRMEHENHVQKQALKGAKIMEASFQEFQKR